MATPRDCQTSHGLQTVFILHLLLMITLFAYGMSIRYVLVQYGFHFG